jgi:cation:H+ antiporter
MSFLSAISSAVSNPAVRLTPRTQWSNLYMDLITLILFILGFVLLIGGAEFLVRGASKLAIAVGISPLVVGLTVVAYGTSAPELAVTINATYSGQSDLALGNVVGSNISNILLVLGIASLIGPLVVKSQLVRQEIPLMILVSVLLLVMALDENIGRFDGIILTIGAVTYTTYVIRKSRRETKRIQHAYDEVFKVERESAKNPVQIVLQLVLILAGLGLLVVGADWLINGAVAIAELLGISKLVIGLTIVAVGTSLPEIATSIIASIRGQRDIAVGNAVGSNLFNILLVLGITAIVAPGGIAVSRTALTFDIPVMIAVALAALPIFYTNYRIDRWEGALFLGYYVAYTAYLFLNATKHGVLDEFEYAMVFFVIPITLITLITFTIKAVRNPNNNQVLTEQQ